MKRQNIRWLAATLVFSLLFASVSLRAQDMNGYEYWFDGNRDNLVSANLAQPAGGVLPIDPTVDINSLPDGFHTISVRMRGKSGWSAASTYRFYKNDKIPGGDISAWEYWWNDDLAGAKRSEVNPPAQHIFFLNEPADMSELCKGIHALNLRFYGSNGWSSTLRYRFEKKTPKVGEEVADFEIIADGGQVSFVNTSQNGTGYRWFFGDGATDTLANPYHSYGIGAYTVRLVNYGFCQNDTLRQELVVPGISGYTPKRAGRNAAVTIAFSGVGFESSGMHVHLQRPGQMLVPETVLVAGSDQMSARFKFVNAPTGKWDLVVKFPDNHTDTISDGFFIEDSTYYQLSVKITSNWRMRSGVKNLLTVTVLNDGNTDAPVIPLAVKGLPEGSKAKFTNKPLGIDRVPPFDTLGISADSIPLVFLDSVSGEESIICFIPYIPAGQPYIIGLEITPPGTANGKWFDVTAELGQSLLDELTDFPASEADYGKCMEQIGLLVWKKLFPKKEIVQCIAGLGKTYYTSVKLWHKLAREENAHIKQYIEYGAPFLYGFGKQILECEKAIGHIYPPGAAVKALIAIAEIVFNTQKYYKILDACVPVFKKIGQDVTQVLFGNSFDPNIKVGPGNGSAGHFYATASGPLVYIIQCENDTSALFAAQTVTIIDTLDLSKLDVSTFRFTHVNVAGYGITLNISGTRFIRDIYLPTGVIARVSGHLDTLTGVVTWVMRTIDPITGQVTADPVAGILQPNFNPPEGDASVGFSIHKLPGLPDDVLIENRAIIIFDSNDPILTNTWGVVSDNVPPTSQINSLPAMQDSVNVHLGWKGEDNHSGVQYYRIYVSDNGGPYYQWRSNDADTSAVFTGQSGHSYRFYSIAVDSAGNVEPPPAGFDAEITIGGGVGTHAVIRHGYRLEQNVPNPFSNQTRIDFTLPEFCPQVRLRVADVPGRTVREFVFRNQAPGMYSVSMGAEELAPGLYFYQLLGPGVRLTRRMVVEK